MVADAEYGSLVERERDGVAEPGVGAADGDAVDVNSKQSVTSEEPTAE